MYWITQLPAALKVTTPDAIEQILDDPAAIVIATLRLELAVAVGVYVPAITGETGGVEVWVMVCERTSASNSAVTVTAKAGIVKAYGPDPVKGAVLLVLYVATRVPALSRMPDFGETVNVTVVPDADGDVAIPIVEVVSPETRVIVPNVIA